MNFILSPNMNFDGIVPIVLGIMLIPAFLMVIIALLLHKKYKKAKKVLYILATVYTIISLGLCGMVI